MMDFELRTNEYAASYPEIEIHTRIMIPQLHKALNSIDIKTLKERVLSAIYDAYTMYDPCKLNLKEKAES
jgi:hypothetical protein